MTRLVAVVAVTLMVVGATVRANADESSAERRIRVLEEQLRRTQEEVRELKAIVEQQKAIGQATQRQVEQVTEEAKTASAAAEKAEKKAPTLPDWLQRTALFGDLRVRYDGIYHQPHKAGQKVTARNRERVRARLGFKFTYSDELSAVIRIASGNPDDPISTNETLTGDFTRKHVNLDWAYLTLTPGKTFGIRPGLFAITGGKFPVSIFRTDELVFDDDLAPEGGNETLALLAAPHGALDQVKIHLLQWTFNEVSNGQDGWMIGGQVNPTAHVGDVQLEGGVGQFYWLNPDLIAQAFNTNSSLFNTNLVTTDAMGTITGFQGAFNQTNVTVAATVPEVIAGQPLKAFGDFVHNWQAPSESNGWQVGLKLGQTKKRGDWAVTGFYEQLEQEAVISAFTFSDFGFGGTNVEGPALGLEYQLLDPLTVSAKSYFVNYIDRPAGLNNPTLVRLLVDAQVKF
jgi:hypothetical protein